MEHWANPTNRNKTDSLLAHTSTPSVERNVDHVISSALLHVAAVQLHGGRMKTHFFTDCTAQPETWSIRAHSTHHRYGPYLVFFTSRCHCAGGTGNTCGQWRITNFSGVLTAFIHLVVSYDRSKASSKASSPHSAIWSVLLQMRVSSPFLKLLRPELLLFLILAHSVYKCE